MNQIKILFLAANPIDTSRLRLDEEIRSITEKIRASKYRESLELISAWAVRPDDLLQLLNTYKPHIVHFSGHGSSAGEIVLVDSDGKPQRVSTKAINALFTTLKDNVRVVILNACYSRIQAEAIAEAIDYTIGMNTAIGDYAAIVFAASFYRAVGFGRSVQEAFDQGKAALLLEGISEDNIPEALARTGIDPSSMFLIEASSPVRRSRSSASQSSKIAPLKLGCKRRTKPSDPIAIEEAIKASDPSDVAFHEIEIRLSDTWDMFLDQLTNETPDFKLESIQEDPDTESSFHCSGRPGHLNYRMIISGAVHGIPITRRIDIIHAWLHPLAIQSGQNTGEIPWDTSLFPIKDEHEREVFIDHPLASCRDCMYWVLFAKPR